MQPLTRSQVMWNGLLKKGDKNILIVKSKEYRITDKLSNKIRLKNILLVIQTFLFTLIYLFSIEKYQEIPLEGNSEQLLQGLGYTALFLFSLVVGVVITSLVFIPKNVSKEVDRFLTIR